MYEVDERDRVVPLEGVPQSSAGAPIPLLIADELRVVLAYYMTPTGPWTGIPKLIDQCESDEPIAMIRFDCDAHMFGPPNDEAFEGHPLASRGLEPYGAFRVIDSSWIRKLERMNRVHRSHRPEPFWTLQHLVFAFHDSTFECVCGRTGFDVKTTHGSMHSVLPTMIEWLFEKRRPT
jgi:hypothetical protein